MKNFWKPVIKSMILFGIAAALWTALTPALATVVAPIVGMHVAAGGSALALLEGTTATALQHTLFVGASFGLFGALYAAAEGVTSMILGNPKPAAQTAEIEKAPSKVSTITIELDPQQSKEITGALSNFQDRVKNGRAVQDSNLSV